MLRYKKIGSFLNSVDFTITADWIGGLVFPIEEISKFSDCGTIVQIEINGDSYFKELDMY